MPDEPPYLSINLDIESPTPQLKGLTEVLVTITTLYQQQLATSFEFSSYFNSFLRDELEQVSDLIEQYREVKRSDFEFKWLSNVKHGVLMQFNRGHSEEGNEAAAKLLAAHIQDEEGIKGFKEYLRLFDEYEQ